MSAKEMFKQLGYNYYEYDDRTKGKIIYYVKGNCLPNESETKYITKYTFALNGFHVESWQSNANYERIATFDSTFITFEELQAINKQIEEMRCS